MHFLSIPCQIFFSQLRPCADDEWEAVGTSYYANHEVYKLDPKARGAALSTLR